LNKWRTADNKRDSFFYLYSKGCVGRWCGGGRKTLTMTENCKAMMLGVWVLMYGIEKCQMKKERDVQ
jgi:hypothetical protein